MRRTRFGRQIYLMGENRVSARAAALPITLLTTAAFAADVALHRRRRRPDRRHEPECVAPPHRELHLRRDRRRARRRKRRHRRTRIGPSDGRRRGLHRDDLRHAAASRLQHRRADPRSRDHRRRRGGLDEPEGAKPMSAQRLSTARIGGVSRFVPYAILAVMVAAMALLPVVTSYTRPHGQRLRHPAELLLVRPRRARAGDHDHGRRVRPLRLVDVPPRRHGRRPHGQRLPARRRARGARRRGHRRLRPGRPDLVLPAELDAGDARADTSSSSGSRTSSATRRASSTRTTTSGSGSTSRSPRCSRFAA